MILARLPERSAPLVIPWPSPAGPVTFLSFDEADDWHAFVQRLSLDERIPDSVRAKFARAQRLYVLGWLDGDLVKAGELAALITLEMAVRDRYAHKLPARQRSFAALLRYMVDVDGLTDGEIPMIVQYGGTAVDRVRGSAKPSLSDLRNGMAHGDPFDALPVGGLLELVRDLVMFAYRHYLAEAPRVSGGGI